MILWGTLRAWGEKKMYLESFFGLGQNPRLGALKRCWAHWDRRPGILRINKKIWLANGLRLTYSCSRNPNGPLIALICITGKSGPHWCQSSRRMESSIREIWWRRPVNGFEYCLVMELLWKRLMHAIWPNWKNIGPKRQRWLHVRRKRVRIGFPSQSRATGTFVKRSAQRWSMSIRAQVTRTHHEGWRTRLNLREFSESSGASCQSLKERRTVFRHAKIRKSAMR